MRPWGFVLVWAAAVLLASSWLGELPFRSASGRYQLVKESPEAALFGEGYEAIGTPQVYVVPDRSVVVKGGEPRISLTRMQAKGEYPLQLVTVEAISGYVRLGSAALGLVGLALTLWRARPGRA